MPDTPASRSSLACNNNPHLYEINTWAWLDELSRKAGKSVALETVPDSEWDQIAERGFHVVWLMGMWQRSPESRRIFLNDPGQRADFDRALPGWTPEDVIGSPYAVRSYTPDPRFGNWKSLDLVRSKLAKRGVALFLDFVGNHTALDHAWISEHPEYYIQGTERDFEREPQSFHRVATSQGVKFVALGRDPYFPAWRDVAQLNHFHPGGREAQLETLRTIAGHCDGVRCDMAMLLLNDVFERIWKPYLNETRPPEREFWKEVFLALPNFVLLAEVYWGLEQRLLDLGFSFSYDKELLDAVHQADAAKVKSRLTAPLCYQIHLARFLENHDEPRRAAVFPNQRLYSVGTLLGTLPGMRIYQQGEIEGRKIRLPIMLKAAAEEPIDEASAAFFEKILRITKDDVFHSGHWNLLDVVPENDSTAANLIAYEWRNAASWKVVVVNLAGAASQGRVHLGHRVSEGKQYVFHDELNDENYLREGSELAHAGLFVRLEGGQAHLFDVSVK
jgi:hypothetical protein